MSATDKLIIPLLDDQFTSDLFTDNAGFIDAKYIDINKPYLDNHVFLIYDADLTDIDNFKRHEKMLKMTNLHSYRYARINGLLFLIYTF